MEFSRIFFKYVMKSYEIKQYLYECRKINVWFKINIILLFYSIILLYYHNIILLYYYIIILLNNVIFWNWQIIYLAFQKIINI